MKLFPYHVIKNLLFSGPVDFSLTSQLFSLCAHILDLFLSRIDSIAGLYPLSAFFRTCLSSLSVNDRIQRNPMMYESEDHEQNTEEKETISKLVIIKLSRLLLRKICLRRIRLQPPALHPLIRDFFPNATLDSDAFFSTMPNPSPELWTYALCLSTSFSLLFLSIPCFSTLSSTWGSLRSSPSCSHYGLLPLSIVDLSMFAPSLCPGLATHSSSYSPSYSTSKFPQD